MNAIIDTGPWVALIDRSESMHSTCLQWFEKYSGRLFSTEAVLTEVLSLLNFSIKAKAAAIDFVITSIIEIAPASIESLKTVKNIMLKYSDLPMDYADATIICLAMDSGIQNIITFDNHFNIYRTKNKKPLKILP